MHYLEFLKSKKLTKRQIDVAELRLIFMSIDEISKDLFISEKTTKFHLRGVYEKLGAKSYLGFYRVMFGYGYLNQESFLEIKNKRFLMLLRRDQ